MTTDQLDTENTTLTRQNTGTIIVNQALVWFTYLVSDSIKPKVKRLRHTCNHCMVFDRDTVME